MRTIDVWRGVLASTLIALGSASAADQPLAERPWMDSGRSADQRAATLLQSMSQDEKLALLFGYFSSDAPWKNYKKPQEGLVQSAGFIGGNARLGIPALTETDAGIGVASQPGEQARPRTALPSNLATAATWDAELAYSGGRMIGDEARLSGFNVLLAGGIDLARDPRNGRNFEYGGEDPWLAASMVAAQVRGIQSNHILSTLKHYAFNDQETNRTTLDARIDERSARMSDLLAFEFAIEQSSPGAIMCAYNRVNGVYSCESGWLLNQVLKTDWGYGGFVMSDWGGVHSTIPAANAGLDQESGYPFDVSPYFADALREAVDDGHVAQSRFDDMTARILRSMFANGLFDDPVSAGDIDFAGHALVTRADAEGSLVLLKNARRILPLGRDIKSIAVIGSHADAGVLSGGGSSQVYATGDLSFTNPHNERRRMIYFPSSPLKALAARSGAHLAYDEGTDIKAAVKLAARSDVVLVFAHQWSAEGWDVTLNLDDDQDALIAAVARANSKVIVILETGGPVLMPWIDQVSAIVEAWFPGTSGGEAIARVLTGEVNPSGRLPLTFPRSSAQLPRPMLDGYPEQAHARTVVDYTIEGAAVGYKWFDRQHLTPLFPFGYGLSYSRFVPSDLSATVQGNRVSVRFMLKNAGPLPGKTVAQVYVSPVQPAASGWEAPKRLGGFRKLDLMAGQSADVTLSIDARLLAAYDSSAGNWSIAEGDYNVLLSRDAATPVAVTTVHLVREILPLHP
jgi:beta-glucosidase